MTMRQLSIFSGQHVYSFLKLSITQVKEVRPEKSDTCSYVEYVSLEKFPAGNFVSISQTLEMIIV